jgi:cytidylate kinase
MSILHQSGCYLSSFGVLARIRTINSTFLSFIVQMRQEKILMNDQRSEKQALIAQMRGVTISREYGSGGGEIARRLATALSWKLIDHEVVVRVAQSLGVSESEVEVHDEYTASFATRLLTTMSTVDPSMMVTDDAVDITTTEESYHDALVRVVDSVARQGKFVLVGRGGQAILANQHDILHIRIVAPMEKRVQYVMQREGLDEDTARSRIQQKERQRGRYLHTHYHEHADDPHLYDLVINISVLSIDHAVELICQALSDKATRLAVSEQELGPGAGFTRYAGQPADFVWRQEDQ